MAKEILRGRHYGTETEYGYTLPKGDTSYISEQRFPPASKHVGQFLDNGARLYPDVGFVEYATPECGTIDELVVHEIAGENLAWEAYGNGKSRIQTLHKRAISPNRAHGNGAHENYETTLDIWNAPEPEKDKTINGLATFFTARTIVTGAGQPTNEGFALGQKMHNITEKSGSGALSSKALVNTRNEPHNGGEEVHRYHHVSGDAIMSAGGMSMRAGMTSLTFHLLEQNVDVSDLFLRHPLKAASIINDITQEKELEERKDDFVNMASHELKTPITSMKLYIDSLMIGLTKFGDARSIKTLTSIKTQTERLQELVNDLLDVSRLQTGKLSFQKEHFRIDELVRETVDTFQDGSKQHKLKLDAKAPVTVLADKFRIYQVLTNLITNAMKYSPEGKEICIKVRRVPGKAVVSVQDFGIGISKDHQKKIFDRLYQVTDSKEKTFPGLGMGLYITKEIIKRHKGTIWVESEKDKGSTFYFSLPAVRNKR